MVNRVVKFTLGLTYRNDMYGCIVEQKSVIRLIPSLLHLNLPSCAMSLGYFVVPCHGPPLPVSIEKLHGNYVCLDADMTAIGTPCQSWIFLRPHLPDPCLVMRIAPLCAVGPTQQVRMVGATRVPAFPHEPDPDYPVPYLHVPGYRPVCMLEYV